jgi:hypothetical protein
MLQGCDHHLSCYFVAGFVVVDPLMPMMTTPRWWKSCCYSISVSLFYSDVEPVLRLFWDCCLNCYLSNFYAFMYTLSSYDSMCNEMISLRLICWSQDQFYVLLSLQSVVLLMALSFFSAGHCPARPKSNIA